MRERRFTISDANTTRRVGVTRTFDPSPACCRPVTRPLGIGVVLAGRYTLVAELGRGGMGAVYEARDLDLGRHVAVKIVLAETAARRPEAQIDLMQEARSLARLAHPNVVTIHDVGVVDDHAFLAMELIRGITLREWARDQTWTAIARAVAAAGRGLAAAHDVGLVHRDVKPDNVLVDHFGNARVIDFGIAHPVTTKEPRFALGSGERNDITRQGTGTPAYMAPEVRNGIAPSSSSDQFSLFVSLFEALTGALPPSDGARIPRRLRRVLDRGLAQAPDARYPSMWSASAAIDAAARSWVTRWLPGGSQ